MYSECFGIFFVLSCIQVHTTTIECPGIQPLPLNPNLIETLNTNIYWTLRIVKDETHNYARPTISREIFRFENGNLTQDSISLLLYKSGKSLLKSHVHFRVDDSFAIFEMVAVDNRIFRSDDIWLPFDVTGIHYEQELGHKYALVHMEEDASFHIMQRCDKKIAYLRVENKRVMSYVLSLDLAEGYRKNEKMTELCKQLNITGLHYYLKGRDIFDAFL